MVRVLVASLVLATAVGAIRAEGPKVSLALKGLDPVELVAGKEVAGKEDLAVTRGRYRYQFATPANKAAFEKNPEQFAVQFGGACARMGPLSGHGSPDRFHIFDGRIYLFASESCRNGFKAAPELHVDKEDAAPRGTAAEIKRGKELVELVLTGFGGAKAVDAVTALRVETTLSYAQKDQAPFVMKKVVAMEFPGKFREEDSYPGWSGITAATPASGFQTSGKVAWEMEPSVRDYFVRRVHRDPLAILKARGEKGFVAIAGGKTKVGETDVEELLVGVHGATTTLYVEPKTGRVVRVTFRDRAGGAIGEVTRTFSDFRKVDGVTLPYGIATAYNGKLTTNPTVTTDAIAINPKSDATLFSKPD